MLKQASSLERVFRVPRIKRDDGRVKMILPPFAGELNGFTLLFEAFIIKFCKHMPVHM
jgi:hypothetical protein